MLRISTLTAWAELEMASVQQNYLKAVVTPYRPTLAILWVASLRDYASIKGDSEVFQDSGSAAIDAPYASLGREVLLPVRWYLFVSSLVCLRQCNCSITKSLGQRSCMQWQQR